MLTRRGFLASVAGLAALGAGGAFWSFRMKLYDGPVSDHFDGTKFFDPNGMEPKPFADVLRWRFTSTQAKWPDWTQTKQDTPPPSVDGNRARLSFVGHASWLIQAGGSNILLDPVWSDRASPFTFVGPKRHNAPGIAFDALPKIDTVLVTHGHYDHLDTTTLSRLAARDNPLVIAPLGNDTTIRSANAAIRVQAYDWNDRVDLGDGLAVTLVRAQHWSARGPFDRNYALWCGFVLETPAGKIYAAGDSGYGDGALFRSIAREHGPLRLTLLPIGAYAPRWFMSNQHMDPDEAVKALLDCGAQQAAAQHHGTFQLTDEAIDEPATLLAQARDKAGLPPEKFLVPSPGDAFEI